MQTATILQMNGRDKNAETATTVEMNGRDKNAETATTVQMNGRDKNAVPHLQNANGNSHTSHNDDVVSKEAHKSCLASLQQSIHGSNKCFSPKLTHFSLTINTFCFQNSGKKLIYYLTFWDSVQMRHDATSNRMSK